MTAGARIVGWIDDGKFGFEEALVGLGCLVVWELLTNVRITPLVRGAGVLLFGSWILMAGLGAGGRGWQAGAVGAAAFAGSFVAGGLERCGSRRYLESLLGGTLPQGRVPARFLTAAELEATTDAVEEQRLVGYVPVRAQDARAGYDSWRDAAPVRRPQTALPAAASHAAAWRRGAAAARSAPLRPHRPAA